MLAFAWNTFFSGWSLGISTAALVAAIGLIRRRRKGQPRCTCGSYMVTAEWCERGHHIGARIGT